MNTHLRASARAQALRLALALLFAGALVFAPHARVVAQTTSQPSAAAALPAGVERVTSVEGITEYRLRNGLRVLLFPDPSKQTITVNITYLVGSRHESYGETGMAHLLEHLVFKGTPTPPRHPEGADRARRAPQRHDLDRPHQLLRDLRRHRREPRVGARPRSRPDGQQLHRQERPRQRDDGRPQRVRDGREQPRQRAPGADDGRRLPLAQLRQDRPSARAPTSRTCRSTGCRPSTGRYYQPDNAVLLVAGKFDEPKALALVDKYFSAASRSPTRALPKLYTAEPTQDGERMVTLRRVGDTQVVAAALPRALGRAPGLRRPRHRLAGARRHARGPAAQGAGRDEEGQLRLRLQLPVA